MSNNLWGIIFLIAFGLQALNAFLVYKGNDNYIARGIGRNWAIIIYSIFALLMLFLAIRDFSL